MRYDFGRESAKGFGGEEAAKGFGVKIGLVT